MTAPDVIATILRAVLAAGIVLTLVPLTVWLERKGAAYIQDRPGPNRAAAFGIFRLGGVTHVVADAIKLIAKEDLMPAHVNPFYWKLAPMLVGMIPLLTFAIIPMADDFRVGSFVTPMALLLLDAGLLWFFAITSLAVYGVVFAGWSSGNKYSLLGGVRSTAQLLSYEIPMAIAAICVILTFGTVQPNEIVRMQGELLFGFIPQWGVVLQPLAAIVFLTCAFAEINRVPFDLAESEAELVAGYHTEYSGMRFGTFFLAEYMALIVSGALSVTLFFGGWQVPFLPTERLVSGAATLLPAFLGLGAVVCGLLGWLGYRHYQTYAKGRWNDRRDFEPLILGSLMFALAMVQLVLAGAAWGARDGLAAWIPPLFATVIQLSAFVAKLCFFCWVFVWVRWSLPRFRYDQLLNLGWKALLPISLLNLLLTGVLLSLASLPPSTTTWIVLGMGILAGSLLVWTFRRQTA